MIGHNLNFLFCIPNTYSIYAGRTIMNGYKNAILAMGHEFKFMTADEENQVFLLDNYKPDFIFISLNKYSLKFLDFNALKKAKKTGAIIFVNTPFWDSPISKFRINETTNLKNDIDLNKFIKSGLGDIYYNMCEQGDLRMKGFEEATGYRCYTIPLAADDTVIYPEYSEKFEADISFIGTNLSDKRQAFNEMLFPLQKKYNLKLYGQDWTLVDKTLGWVQRGGQYFNFPYLKSFRKPKLRLEDERKVYNSSIISINIHEEYQRKFGGDCNERTFKIPLAGGFEITDNVECIKKYFIEGQEIIIAKDKKDWFDKIDYYMKNLDKRDKTIEAGRMRVLRDHTYKNRVAQLINIAEGLRHCD